MPRALRCPAEPIPYVVGHWRTFMIVIACLSYTAQSAKCQQMVFPDASWREVAPEAVLVDSDRLQDAVEYLSANSPEDGADELFIVRNGRMIWQGPNADNAHHVYSVTKSFAGTALGLLIDDELVTLDTLAHEYVPGMASEYPDVTLRHLVTHTSGYVAPGEDNAARMAAENPFEPDSPVFTPPGSYFVYANSAMDQMINILRPAGGEPVDELFQRRIGTPIGLVPTSWNWTKYELSDETAVAAGSGVPGKGVSISARDIARFGHLFLNRGDWNGQQLISAEWIDQATTVQVPETTPLHQDSITIGPGVYGYGWWVNATSSRPYGSAPYGAYAALGGANNHLWVIRDWDMVIARLGQHEGDIAWNGFLSRIALAQRVEAIWDEAGDGVWTDIDPVSTLSRWRSESGEPAVVYPDNLQVNAVVRTNVVEILDERTVGALDVEGGVVAITPSGSFLASGTVAVAPLGSLDVDGTLETRRLDANGSVSIASGAQLTARNLTVDVSANVSIEGAATVRTANVNSGTITVAGGGVIQLGDLRQSDGTVLVAGEAMVEEIDITGGTLEMYGAQSLLTVEDGFVMGDDARVGFALSDTPQGTTVTFSGDVTPELRGTLALELLGSTELVTMHGQTISLFDWGVPLDETNAFGQIELPLGRWDLSRLYTSGDVVLNALPGDANGDLEFNQLDVIAVLSAGKYLTGERATWGEGDWNNDDVFDQLDVVAAAQTGLYLTGPYAAGNRELAALPEPSTLVLALIAAMVAGMSIRRTIV